MKTDYISKLEQIFRMVDDNDLLDFCKEYAFGHRDLVESLIKKFIPSKSSAAALKQEVWKLFEEAPERHAKWGPSLDWRWIDEGLYRLVLKARYLLTEGDLNAAASVTVEILSAVGEWYAEDEVYSDEDFDSENFCTSDAASLLIDILESGKLQEDSLEKTVSDIRKASRLDAYRSYCILDMEELLFVADHAGLPPEKYISALTDRIDSDGRSRTKWLLREASYLRARGMRRELESLVNSNMDVTELCNILIDAHLSAGNYDEAVAFIRKAIDSNSNESVFVYRCWERMYNAYEVLENVDGEIEALEQMLYDGVIDIRKNYEQLKILYRRTGQEGRVKEIVSHLAAKKSFFNRKEISGICAEEHMIPQLVESLRWDDLRSEECLESLKQYSGLLDGKQREGLVTSYVENLRMDAVEVNSSHYGRIRYSMELLRDSCPEGAAAVESLASEFCELYHRRPAFMREMRRLMSVRECQDS